MQRSRTLGAMYFGIVVLVAGSHLQAGSMLSRSPRKPPRQRRT